jgi:hypothetical protein
MNGTLSSCTAPIWDRLLNATTFSVADEGFGPTVSLGALRRPQVTAVVSFNQSLSRIVLQDAVSDGRLDKIVSRDPYVYVVHHQVSDMAYVLRGVATQISIEVKIFAKISGLEFQRTLRLRPVDRQRKADASSMERSRGSGKRKVGA